MRPIVTLLTDFGLADTYVAEMKAAILTEATDIRLVDLSHEVSPGDIRCAQYLLGRAWGRFPLGTVHLVIVDPGVGSGRRAMAVHHAGHFFVGPDNGVFTAVLDGSELLELRIPRRSAPTFQGRDVFAPAAAHLAQGESFKVLGPALTSPVRAPLPTPRKVDGVVEGEVIHVDRFGTLIANIPENLAAGAQQIEVAGKPVGSLMRTYADVDSGALVGFIGSEGLLQIGVRDGSAATKLGAGVGAEVKVRFGLVEVSSPS
jgi:S-adenosylmethionine hydrolase